MYCNNTSQQVLFLKYFFGNSLDSTTICFTKINYCCFTAIKYLTSVVITIKLLNGSIKCITTKNVSGKMTLNICCLHCWTDNRFSYSDNEKTAIKNGIFRCFLKLDSQLQVVLVRQVNIK